ncbi:zinc finger domain-containing protein [Streptomyces sp. SYSU K217416]
MPQLAEPAAAVEQFDCPTCEVPAGSTCRTRGGKVAPKYHTPRFTLVPQLRAELEVKTPADRARAGCSGVSGQWRVRCIA